MSKPQEMMELVNKLFTYLPVEYKVYDDICDIHAKLKTIAKRQDRLLEVARYYVDELVYNDYVPRSGAEIAEVNKLIAECEGEK